MSTRCYILNLPLEVLNLIYQSIPNMRDKLNFAKAHGVLGKAFAFHAGDIFKTINIEDRPIQDWSHILSLCGSSVTYIQTYDEYTAVDVVKLASMYCPNLEGFFFRVRSRFWKLIKPLLLPLQNLDSIEISNSFEKVNVVETLLQLPKLENLILHDFNRQDLEDVGKLVTLKGLNIDGEPDDISKLCSQMYNIEFGIIRMPKNHAEEQLWPNIELLDISYMDFNTSLPYLPTLKYLIMRKTRMSLTDLFGQSAFSYGKTLEELYFCPEVPRVIYADNIGIISKLKALKRLTLPLGNDDCMDGVSQLENLEMLDVLCVRNSFITNPPQITNRGVMMVINGCKKLRHLNISQCHMVDSNMVEEAVTALSLRPKEDNPLSVCVSDHFGYVDQIKLGGVLNVLHLYS